MRSIKPYKPYYILATINIITIVIALLLAYLVFQTYNEASIINSRWIGEIEKYDQIIDLTIKANSPANDIFKTKDYLGEYDKLLKANKKINHILNDILKNQDNSQETIESLNKFKMFLQKGNSLSKEIISMLKENKLDEASKVMADMDGSFHAALLEILSAKRNLRLTQEDSLKSYHKKASGIFYKEIYVTIIIALLIALILFIGNKNKI